MYASAILYSQTQLSVQRVRVLTNGNFAAAEEFLGRASRTASHESRVVVKRYRREYKFAIFYTRRPSGPYNPHVWSAVHWLWRGDILVLSLRPDERYASTTDDTLARAIHPSSCPKCKFQESGAEEPPVPPGSSRECFFVPRPSAFALFLVQYTKQLLTIAIVMNNASATATKPLTSDELCLVIAYETVARLKCAPIPAFVTACKSRRSIPPTSSKGPSVAFKAEFTLVAERHMDELVEHFPVMKDLRNRDDPLASLAQTMWALVKKKEGMRDIAREAHEKGRRIITAQVAQKKAQRAQSSAAGAAE
ncbi:hypothetical protein AURDEDRAFT_124795 [Auricularia subglabra TFB-10046 SS5]|nr:hypothetical protein AURDEDRAFT_124795 [Auricularia subglabra TFB-10046 SS5]